MSGQHSARSIIGFRPHLLDLQMNSLKSSSLHPYFSNRNKVNVLHSTFDLWPPVVSSFPTLNWAGKHEDEHLTCSPLYPCLITPASSSEKLQ